jgi:hypothetical protein
LISTISLCLRAQENFVPGLIFKNNNDTVRGKIDFRDWTYNPNKIVFRPDDGSAQEKLGPTEIAGFIVEGETYRSGIVQVETSSLDYQELQESEGFNLQTDSVFLSILFEGSKSLYYYNKNNGREYFYIKENNKYQWLQYKRFIRFEDGEKRIIDDSTYIRQLSIYLNDCASVKKVISKLPYKLSGMQAAFKKYFDCVGKKTYKEEINNKALFQAGITLGISSSNVSFSSSNFTELTMAKYKPSVSPAGGIFAEFIFPRKRQRWSFYNELFFSSYSITGNYQLPGSSANYRKYIITLDYSYLKLNNLIRYRSSNGNIRFMANIGISNGLTIQAKNNLKSIYHILNGDVINNEAAIPVERKHEEGLLLGIGGLYKKFSAELRFEFSSGMSQTKGLDASVRRTFLLINYRIK